MNSPRPQQFALSLLIAGGALFFVTRGGEAPQEFDGSTTIPFPTEAGESSRALSPSSPLAERSAGVAVDTPYGAWMGVEFVYQTEFDSVVEITAGGSKEIVKHTLSGRQVVRMVDRTHEGFMAAYSWPELEVSLVQNGVKASEEETEEMRRELKRPVLVYYADKGDPNGVQQALRFTEGVTTGSRDWARTLIAVQRAPISKVSTDGFEMVEADVAGRFRCHYQVLDLEEDVARVSREKLEALDGVAWSEEAGAPHVSGEGLVKFSEGWFESVDWREQSTATVEAENLKITQGFTAKIRRISVGAFLGDEVNDWNLEVHWSSFDGNSDNDATFAGSSDGFDVEFLADADVDALVKRLVSLDLANASGAEALLTAERLALIIADDPEALANLKTELSSGRLSKNAASKILGAITNAGTPEAQTALCELFMLPNPPDGLRDAAELALFKLQSVSAETVSAFQEVLSDEEAGDELRRASWLLLGAFAETGSDHELTKSLVSMEPRATGAGELLSWLEALGNTRSPEVFEAAQRHLGSEDPKTRLCAVRALRHLESTDVIQALVGQAGADEDLTVRAEAISLLAGRVQEGVATAVSELLHEEPEVDVRRAALDALVNRPMDEEVLELLSSVASSDPDTSLRAYALTLLGS